MRDALIHRGPDGEGLFHDNNIGLGHRRLSIIDLTNQGSQPMWTNDRSMVIVFNGEVYNYKEIRQVLLKKGYIFHSNTDTEVVINAIHCWGLDIALGKFIGMFAFAYWDMRDRSLCLVRDRLGVKPLYYYHTNNQILFASELKALYQHPDFIKSLNNKGLGQYFCTGYTIGENTVLDDTKKMLAGHYLIIKENGDSKLEQYWSLDHIKRGSYKGSYIDAQEELISLLESSFKYRMVSDVPVGIFLSGGIDSTLLSQFLKERLNYDLEHITIGFEDKAFNESDKAEKVASELNLKHHIKTIGINEAQDEISNFTEIWDEPFGDTSGIPTAILCRYARTKVKVALSADGGDEIFCGYDSYDTYSNYFRKLNKFPIKFRSLLSDLMGRSPYMSIISNVIGLRSEQRWKPQTIARFEKLLNLINVDSINQLLRVMGEKGWTTSTAGKLIGTSRNDFFTDTIFDSNLDVNDPIDSMMRTDISAFLGDDILTKVDRASMASSLECRDPFLDHRLIEFAYSLPMGFIFQRNNHKRILKDVIKKSISPSILNSPKRGFSIPLYNWLRGPWKPLVDEYLSPKKVKEIGILDEREVEKELRNFYRYKGGRAEKIMLMLNFQLWAKRWY